MQGIDVRPHTAIKKKPQGIHNGCLAANYLKFNKFLPILSAQTFKMTVSKNIFWCDKRSDGYASKHAIRKNEISFQDRLQPRW